MTAQNELNAVFCELDQSTDRALAGLARTRAAALRPDQRLPHWSIMLGCEFALVGLWLFIMAEMIKSGL